MVGTLGIVAGEGELPHLVAAEARRQGWRVVVFAFSDPSTVAEHAHVIMPCSLTDIHAVYQAFQAESIRSVLFSGRLWKRELLQDLPWDAPGRQLMENAGGLTDEGLVEAVLRTLDGFGIQVLDQRDFLRPFLSPPGLLTRGEPTPGQWEDIRLGLRVAQQMAVFGIGQTLVLRQGMVLALEAAEGTDEAIRRGCRLGGPGSVVAKATHGAHDFRFDIPTVGMETLNTLIEGRASVLAVEARRVLLLNPETMIASANREGIAIVSVDHR
ncbi:MAG TPA: UDP-2,3-diacylglucosamine diphosphatase LpxI [Methylomirabilota bacterium]|nr:UDP-2,3-diacylglucosamine diphosphatase LpxI [Methylomirabilota bacterium]